ncbi:MAG: hypothetical protein BAJALOKI2v1_480013 [Promethearchaeota archaeon]|nr:MAG: hypothetical protein BAJALOKI2v1_480013 [Candidatus Lokiarchaeota archaeon]
MVEKGDLTEINKPIFSTGDVYLIDDQSKIYVWIGSKCSVDEKTTGAAKARELDQQRGGAAKIVTVDQGQEGADFLKLVAEMGVMKVVDQNIAKTMLKDVLTGDYAQFSEHINVLYRVSSEEFEDINAMKMIQVPYSSDSLDSEDCFVMDLGNKVYIWQGNACNVKEKVKSGQWARKIDADRAGLQNEQIFEEGDDEEFFKALEKGPHYKESDATQLKAESVMEGKDEDDKIAEKVQPEHKAEIKETAPPLEEETKPVKEEVEEKPVQEEIQEEPVEKEGEKKVESSIKPEKPEIKTSKASQAAPGIPGQEDESIMTIDKHEGRRVCPNCGNENKETIHESVDKSNIILDYPRMYGKKYKCGLCGTEWREK